VCERERGRERGGGTERDQTCCTASRPSNSEIQRERVREIRHAVQQAGPQIKKSREMLYSKQALKLKNPERER